MQRLQPGLRRARAPDRPAGQQPYDPPQVQDLWARLLFSPVLGAGIPNLARLIDHREHSVAALAGTYAYFSVLAFVIWEGNRRLYFHFRDPDVWLTHAWQRVAVLLGCVFLYTVPVSTAGLLLWRLAAGDTRMTTRSMAAAVLLTVVCTLFIVHVYETVFLLRRWESDRIRSEKLQRVAVEAELEALKREINPHVLFNNLHTLAHLIETGSDRASGFVMTLAEVYRYLLEARRQWLVTLDEELALLDEYATLADIRCAGALRVDVVVPQDARARLRLPPVTLPELLENAVKHNAMAPERPLTLTVRLEGDTLVVSNELRPKAAPGPSTGVGLSNLAHRFALTTGAPVTWTAADGRFEARLALTDTPDPL